MLMMDSMTWKKEHPLYVTWQSMKQRCFNPKHTAYKRYGGRGISICGEWLHDYTEFEKWFLEHDWHKGMTIDRIDNACGYSPDNCRIITRSQNSHNTLGMEHTKRSSRRVVCDRCGKVEYGITFKMGLCYACYKREGLYCIIRTICPSLKISYKEFYNRFSGVKQG